LKVIDVDNNKNSLPVLVMTSSMFVPICNRFHARRAIYQLHINYFEKDTVFNTRIRKPF